MKIRVRVTIDAPVARVWAAVERIETHVEWMTDAESIEFTTARTSGEGAAFVCVTKIGPFRTRDFMTVTEWSPRRAIGIEHRGIVRGKGRFTLRRARGKRTKFSWEERLVFPWRIGGPVIAFAAKPIFRAIWKRNLRRLKASIESGGL